MNAEYFSKILKELFEDRLNLLNDLMKLPAASGWGIKNHNKVASALTPYKDYIKIISFLDLADMALRNN